MKWKEILKDIAPILTVGLAVIAVWQTSNLWILNARLNRPYLSVVPVYLKSSNGEISLSVEIKNIGNRPVSNVVFIKDYTNNEPEFQKINGNIGIFFNDLPPDATPKSVDLNLKQTDKIFDLQKTSRYLIVQICYQDALMDDHYKEIVYAKWLANDSIKAGKEDRFPWAHISNEEEKNKLDKVLNNEIDNLKPSDQIKLKQSCEKKDNNFNLTNLWKMFF
jgi:hypothetical protein